jgi:hypothetical protein
MLRSLLALAVLLCATWAEGAQPPSGPNPQAAADADLSTLPIIREADGSLRIELGDIRLTESRVLRGADGELYILCVAPHTSEPSLGAHLHRLTARRPASVRE